MGDKSNENGHLHADENSRPRQSMESVAEDGPVARVIIEEVDGVPRTRIVLGSTKGASSFSSVFTLCNSCIGAGVLSLPYAFRRAGKLAEISKQSGSIIAILDVIEWHRVVNEQDLTASLLLRP